MLIILFIVGLIGAVLIIGKINLTNRFSKEVKQLFSQSGDISNKTFDYNMLANLPEPVQRYFRHVLKNGQPYISYVRLTHTGQFKTNQNKDWVDIQGEQYFTTEKPGFIWKGVTSMFMARDMYIRDTGRLVVSLFSIFNIADGKGEKLDQGELLRWLGESVWFPTNLLPDENLQWTSIDNTSSKLTFSYAGLTIFYIVDFNDIGEITQLRTERYMGNENLEPWVGKLSDYKEINDIIIPTAIEGIWKLAKGDYSYAKFKVKAIEYNKPEKF
ncbi:MAG: hypothetical protein KF746_16180 [Chitinophagaceae bacterium]|nr:hypothetical protein [Chitinophagaceae bacterium]